MLGAIGAVIGGEKKVGELDMGRGVVRMALEQVFQALDGIGPEPVARVVVAEAVAVGAVVEADLEDQLAHLVARGVAVEDAFRRVVGVHWIAGGVVVLEVHLQARATREGDGIFEDVGVLHVEVPVLDAEQLAAHAVGEGGEGLEVLAEVMGVGGDLDGLDIDGERVAGGDGVVVRTGGDSIDVERSMSLYCSPVGGLSVK